MYTFGLKQVIISKNPFKECVAITNNTLQTKAG